MYRDDLSRKVAFAGTVFVLMGLLAGPIWAQRIFGDIQGIVTDPSGAAVEARISLRNMDTGRELITKSAPDGSYSFVELAPGRYEVTGELEGFGRKVISSIMLSASQRARVDISLAVGSVSTVVEVEAGLVQTETHELSEVVEQRRIQELPVNGRSYLSLALTTPGVILGGSQGLKSNTSNFTVRNNQSIWIAGHRESSVNYIIDGIETRNNRWANVSFRPSIDMISEFKIERNAYGGEIGIDGGTVVNITTKGGSNEFHGSVFEFFRNNALNARNFFDRGKAPFHDNNFGGVVGGPIVRNKLFFFGSYEGDRSRLGQTFQGLFPSAGQLQGGNLADDSAGTGIFPTNSPFCQGNPGSPKCRDIRDPTNGIPFPNNVIPQSRMATFSKGYAAEFLPAANALDRLPLGVNRLANPPTSSNWNQWSARIDHNISAKDTVFYRFIWVNEPFFQPALNIGGGLSVPLQGRNLAIGWTRVISPQVVNTFHAGWNKGVWRYASEFIDPISGGERNFAQELGLKNTSTNPMHWSVPGVSLVGFSGLGSGFTTLGNTDENYQFSDTVNYVKGIHNIRFGGEYRRQSYLGLSAGAAAPRFTFNGNYTGSSLGDFLLGIPNQAGYSLGDGTGDFRLNLYAVYVSDSIKLKPNLTMSIGLGWEYKSPPREINNKMGIFDFTAKKYLIAGRDFEGSPIDKFYGSYKPQLGFAWQPFGSGKTVIRTGFGMYWESQKANDYEGLYLNAPFIYPANFNSGATPTIFVDNLFPVIDPNGPIPLTVETQTRFMHEKRPYSPEWNFSIQQQFGQTWMVQAAYEGASFIRGGSFNQANPGAVDPTGRIPLQERRLLTTEYGDINLNTSMNHGYYHGATLSLKKRFSDGFSIDGHYTWSHSIDNGTNEINNADFPMVGRKFERGHSDIDIRHRFVVSYIYELPFGKGRRFLNRGGAANAILGGWQVSGITTFMTGPPDKVTMPGNWLNIGTRVSGRPNCIANPHDSSLADNVRSNGLYFKTSAFARPPLFTPGNCGRNILRSPGLNNFDISVQKNTAFTDRWMLQTRFEFFNVWNHAQWQMWSGRSGGSYGYGEPGFGNASFGKVTAARDPRIIQIAMKLVF